MQLRRILLSSALILTLIASVPAGTLAGGRDDGASVTIRDGRVQVITTDDDGQHRSFHYRIGNGAFLGVRLDGHDDGRGARVEQVMEDTAAERAGLRDGDRIVEVDGHRIDDIGDLMERMGDFEPGDRVDMEVERDGRRERLTVELGERTGHRHFFGHGFDAEEFGERMSELGERMGELGERLGEQFGRGFAFDFDGNFNFDGHFDSEQFQERMRELGERLGDLDIDIQIPHFDGNHDFRWVGSRPKLGVTLVETTRELREHLGGGEDAGVLVSRVMPDMPAEAAGVQVGDLIVAVDDEVVSSADDLRRALRDRAGETIELEVVRDGRTIVLDVELDEVSPARNRGRAGGGMYRSSLSATDAALRAYTRALGAGERAQGVVEDRVREALEQYQRALAISRDIADTY